MDNPTDLTLDEMRPILAARLATHVPFDGWSFKAVDAAAADCGIDPAAARLAFKDGEVAMIEAWLDQADDSMLSVLDSDSFRALSIRRRIAYAIKTRLEQAEPHREAVRRAVALLALPGNTPLATKRAWKTADAIWRASGDTSTDFNHYSKRTILASLYSATLLIWLDDESEGHSRTWGFLDRRIDNIMQFEKLKANFRSRTSSANRPSLTRFLGRLRYPVNQDS